MKKLFALAFAIALAGCATAPQSLMAKPVPHRNVVACPPVVVPPAPPAKLTLKDRWLAFKHKHPFKWLHH